jgi:phosphate-selective porin OprO/OprP
MKKGLLWGLAALAALMMTTGARADDDTTINVYWKDGLRLDTGNKAFRLKIGGRIMNDWGFFDVPNSIETFSTELDGGGLPVPAIGKQDDGTEFRRARLYVAGELYNRIIFKAQYDFAGGAADFKDVYLGMKFGGPAPGKVRVGHIKEAFSLEQLTSSKYITFMERALPVEALSPERNTGLGVNLELLDEMMTFAAGVYRDGDNFGDASGHDWDVATRLTAAPLNGDDGAQVVHLGFSYTHKNRDQGIRFRSRPESHLASRFVDTDTFDADSADIFGFEGAAVFGPASVQGEYMLAKVDRTMASDPTFSGYYVFASYFLTGEHRRYKTSEGAFDRVKPNRNFLDDHGLGAIEFAVRYSNLDLDSSGVTGGQLQDVTTGLNWYLNPNTRVMVNWVWANVDRGGGLPDAMLMPTTVDADANIFQTRFQIDF